ncbi:MAG: universal stress protein [Nitrosospira sp.]|nr:universal stress protein [Nitrosospira sp.]
MYKKVVVAIDDSEVSQSALQEAVQIAASYSARLVIIHALQTTRDTSDITRFAAIQLLEQAKAAAGEAKTVETRLVEADADHGLNGVAETIADAVSQSEADLLVVGSQGRRGLERLVIGSVAEKLISTVGISIFIVRLH